MLLCRHYGKCGGCQLQNLSYKEQLERKVEKVINLFKLEPEETIPSPKIYYYRNRMDWVVGPEYKVGLKEKGKWWAYVDIEECLLQSEESNIIRNKFREFIKEKNLEPWDTVKHKGFVRYIVIREGKFTNERMVTIITYKTEDLNYYKNLWLEFFEEIKDFVTSFYWGINPTFGDVSYAYEKYHLCGNLYLKEKLLDNFYLIGPNSFFQPNSYTAEILLKKVIEFLEPKENEIIYDLYSGVGTFSIEIAKYAKEVISIDSEPETEELFYKNCEINGIKNCKFILKRAENINKLSANKVVLDPPRSGLHPKVIKLLGKSYIKRIIYVSCNPETQIRDIKQLEKFGYKLERYILIDQFPHTIHIESIAILNKE